LFAFFAYEPKTVHDLHSKKADDYYSHCDRTMVGWYHSADLANWGCFRAQKTGVAAWSPPQYNSRARNHLDADDVVAPVMLETESEVSMFVANREFVDAINQDALSLWQARVPVELEVQSERSLLEMTGRTKFQKASLLRQSIEHAQHHINFHRAGHHVGSRVRYMHNSNLIATTGSYIHSAVDEQMQRDHGVPDTMDWRSAPDADGNMVDYTAEVRSQGHCGSCYAFAASAMAESRIRIASKNRDQTVLSPQAMISCSVTNQGCMGGYPYLLAKHAHEQGFVPESCLPYHNPKHTKCSAMCQDSDMYFSSPEYGYIGGFYGGSSEAAMMKELAENGPFVVALFAPRALFYYKSGILKVSEFDPKRGREEDHWQETNHAVLVVGYGVDHTQAEPVKYWIVQNTWGSHWGDHGFFKIVRGVNECAIESMPIYFHLTPKVSRANLKSIRPQFIQTEMLQRQAAALVQFEQDRSANAESAVKTEHGLADEQEEKQAKAKHCANGGVCPGYYYDASPAGDVLQHRAAESDD
jgi:cathepsin C